MKKIKFLSVLLMTLMLSIISVKAKEVSTASEIQDCMTSSNDNVCKLTADINITSNIVITSDKTLDLNGHTLELVNCNNSVIEVTGVKLTVDDETFTFKSNKFSTYVLGYTDKEEKTETPKEEVKEETKTEIEPPKTFDSGISYIIMAIVSLIIVSYTVMYFKKRYN